MDCLAKSRQRERKSRLPVPPLPPSPSHPHSPHRHTCISHTHKTTGTMWTTVERVREYVHCTCILCRVCTCTREWSGLIRGNCVHICSVLYMYMWRQLHHCINISTLHVHVHVNGCYQTVSLLYTCTGVHVLTRDEKEERKKQARSNKQTRQSNTARPR